MRWWVLHSLDNDREILGRTLWPARAPGEQILQILHLRWLLIKEGQRWYSVEGPKGFLLNSESWVMMPGPMVFYELAIRERWLVVEGALDERARWMNPAPQALRMGAGGIVGEARRDKGVPKVTVDGGAGIRAKARGVARLPRPGSARRAAGAGGSRSA